MKSIVLSLMFLMAATAFGQDPVAPTEEPSAMPIEKVRKIYVGVDLYHGQWQNLYDPSTLESFINPVAKEKMRLLVAKEKSLFRSKPKGHFKEKLAKQLAGACLEITESRSEADAVLEMDYRTPSDDGTGITTCRSTTSGVIGRTSCSGGGVWTTDTYGPHGGSSMSGPIILEELVLRDAKTGGKIGDWSLFAHAVKPSRFHEGLRKSLLDAVGCGSGAQ